MPLLRSIQKQISFNCSEGEKSHDKKQSKKKGFSGRNVRRTRPSGALSCYDLGINRKKKCYRISVSHREKDKTGDLQDNSTNPSKLFFPRSFSFPSAKGLNSVKKCVEASRQRKILRKAEKERLLLEMDNLRSHVLCEQLYQLASDQYVILNNRDDLNADYVQSIGESFSVIKETTYPLISKLRLVETDLAPKFDFDESCRANGFWSLCRVCKLCCIKLIEIVNHVTSYHYQSTLLKTRSPIRDLKAFTECLTGLGKMMDFIVSNSELFKTSGNLIISLDNHSEELIQDLYDQFEELPRAPFYGRTIGFQYEASLFNPLLAIVVSELSYAELYESNGFARKASAIFSGGKFYLNNKLRGHCMEALSRYCDMSFGKSFWSLTELSMVQHVPSLVCNSVDVNRVIELEKENILIIPPGNCFDKRCEVVEVPYPHSIGCQDSSSPPFFMRLISYIAREGMPDIPVSGSTAGAVFGAINLASPSTSSSHNATISAPTAINASNIQWTVVPETFLTSNMPPYSYQNQAPNQTTPNLSSRQSKRKQVAPPSDALVLHIHGGGFVSQSSKSHEIYLRSWAKFLNVPIVSIDYSLAPEYPFPTAVDECFYCYCWILSNLEKLGCKKSARICVVGDSAGGNLVLALSLRCIQTNVRKPDGLVPIYPAVFPQYALSPSRVMSIMDCLLAVGILDQCLLAYLGAPDPLPPFKMSRVLEIYQGEWEYSFTDPTSNGVAGLAMLPTLACGSWLYRLVRRPNTEASSKSKRPDERSCSSQSSADPVNFVSQSDSIKNFKLEMVENDEWLSISRCSSHAMSNSTQEQSTDAVKVLLSDSEDEVEYVDGDMKADPDDLESLQASSDFVLLNKSIDIAKAETEKGSEDANLKTVDEEKRRRNSGSFTGKALAARKPIGSLKLMSRLHRQKHSNSDAKTRNSEATQAVNVDAHLDKSGETEVYGIPKSSSLPSFESHQTLKEVECCDESKCQDDFVRNETPNSYSWLRRGRGKKSPNLNLPSVAAPIVVQPNGSKSKGKSSTAVFAADDKSTQPLLQFNEEMRELRYRKKVAILNTISNCHVKNPLHCPLLATDEELKELPPISVVVGDMDPLLDESVVFARRLKQLDRPVTFDVMESLPHGFLNFVLVSKLCRDASDRCQKRILEIIQGQSVKTEGVTHGSPPSDTPV